VACQQAAPAIVSISGLGTLSPEEQGGRRDQRNHGQPNVFAARGDVLRRYPRTQFRAGQFQDHMMPLEQRVFASYWIETAFPLEDAAATMAGEQSTGTFVRVPGETDELRTRPSPTCRARYFVLADLQFWTIAPQPSRDRGGQPV
jgi:hypothetical protein